MYVLGFIKPETPSNMYLFHAEYNNTNPSYVKLMENIKSEKFIFPQNLNGIERGTYEYFIYDGNLYSLESSSNTVTLIDSGNWTHIAGSTGCDLGNGHRTVGFGIKSGRLFKIYENVIEEIGNTMSSNTFINVTGTTTQDSESTYGEHAYALTDKNEIFAIGTALEASNISIFTEENVINYFGGMHYYEATPHVIVDNKLYLIDKTSIILRDDTKKWVKVYGAYAEYTGSVCYQYGITEDGNCYKLYTSGTPNANTIIKGNQEDNTKWEYVAGSRYRGATYIPAIANKNLYLFIPGITPDDSHDEGDTDPQKAYLLDDTRNYDWVSDNTSVNDPTYIALAENKLYHIKITQSFDDETTTISYNPTITELPMPEGHTKCISCNQYGLYDNFIIPIFQ